jgi:high affinity Mn2+ porin
MGRIRFIGVLVALLMACSVEPASAATLAGVGVDAVLTGMAQQVDRAGTASGRAESHLTYRGDLSATLPAGTVGDATGALFVMLRFGQGTGVDMRPTYAATPNTTGFELADGDPDAVFAILAQAWYQLDVPLSRGGVAPRSAQRLSFTAGKIDPFLFFDQNAAADDESLRFTNNAFVHNPLLDSGGDAGVDAYGFTPGLRVAWAHDTAAARNWGVSFAALGSGPAAEFAGPPDRPFVIGQIEASTPLIGHLPGSYRLYAWRNGYAEDFDGTLAAHSGWGMSADQRVGEALTLFGRYGDRLGGNGAIDRALTLGAEIRGNYWRRGADATGFAIGWLRTSREFRDATADGQLTGYAASGSECLAEFYYRFEVGDHVAITPDLQWIQRPGGDGSAPTSMIIGLRVRVGL